MKKCSRAAILILLFSVMLFPEQTWAREVINTAKATTLTIQYEHGGMPFSEVSFSIYYVAKVSPKAEFSLTGDFSKYPVSVTGLDSEGLKTLANTLYGFVQIDDLTPMDSGKTDENGILTFPQMQAKLKPGLYLVVGEQHCEEGYIYMSEPFLISLPNYDDSSEQWGYDVTVEPKYNRKDSSSYDKVSLNVMKVWKNDDNSESRPKEITVYLLYYGEVYDTVTLNADNNWRNTWGGIEDSFGWNVVERDVPEGYTVTVARDGVNYVVTNDLEADTLNIADTPSDSRLPQTGMLWWPVPCLSIIGMLLFLAGWIIRKRESNYDI